MSSRAVDPRPTLTLSVLNAYFGETTDLLSYLSERLVTRHGRTSEYLLRDTDSLAYRTLISTAYVASNPSTVDSNNKAPFKVYPPMMYMREVGLLSLYECRPRDLLVEAY
jgi:hypothetical protein